MSSPVRRHRAATALLLSSGLAAVTGALALRQHEAEFRTVADRAFAGVDFGTMTVDTDVHWYGSVETLTVMVAVMLLGVTAVAAFVPASARIMAWLASPIAMVAGALPALSGYAVVAMTFDFEPSADELAARDRLRSGLTWLDGGGWHTAVVIAGWVMALAPIVAGFVSPGPRRVSLVAGVRWPRRRETLESVNVADLRL